MYLQQSVLLRVIVRLVSRHCSRVTNADYSSDASNPIQSRCFLFLLLSLLMQSLFWIFFPHSPNNQLPPPDKGLYVLEQFLFSCLLWFLLECCSSSSFPVIHFRFSFSSLLYVFCLSVFLLLSHVIFELFILFVCFAVGSFIFFFLCFVLFVVDVVVAVVIIVVMLFYCLVLVGFVHLGVIVCICCSIFGVLWFVVLVLGLVCFWAVLPETLQGERGGWAIWRRDQKIQVPR